METRQSEYAAKLMAAGFEHAYYIGRIQIHTQDSGEPAHKIYYIGHSDIVGVATPEKRGRWGFQIWGMGWVQGRSKRLDKALAAALKGSFPDVRHNVRVDRRATIHGPQFIKPTATITPQETTTEKTTPGLFPIRGRKRTQRRKLNKRRKLNI